MVKSFWNEMLKFVPNLLGSLIIGIGGILLLRILNKFIRKALHKSKIDNTVRLFLLSLSRILLYIVFIIIFLSSLGVDTNSLLAILSVVGVAISLAVKDSLSHLAGGILILFAKPFNIGDFIEVDNKIKGTIKSISILYTKLNTVDNKLVYIPNGKISTDMIINYSSESKRRLDLVIGISYDDDFETAKEILKKIVYESDLTIKDPKPLINVLEFADNSINIALRVWVKTEDYIELGFELHENIKKEFDKSGINIPYNQMDIRIKN